MQIMKKALLFLIFLVITISCDTNYEGYLIKGVIKGEEIAIKDGIIYIQKANTKSIFDSTQIKKGRFTFKGKLQIPDKYMIFMKELNYNIPIYLENTTFRVEALSHNLREAIVTGGLTQELMNNTTSKSRAVMTKYNLNHILGELLKQDLSDELRSQYSSVVNIANNEMKNFIDSIVGANPTSFYSLLKLNEVVNVGKIEELEKRVESFERSGQFQGNSYLVQIREIIEKRRVLEPGQTAPDFSLLSSEGSMVTLSNIYKDNRFTLLIFWSSWSSESMQFCKKIGEYYSFYRDRGVEIVAITVGDIEKTWREKIKSESFLWIHLKDSEQATVTSMYNVQMIPHSILIDSEGKIIMNNKSAQETIDYLGGNLVHN